MKKEPQTYELFDNRYSVLIGVNKGCTINSNVRKPKKETKIYGIGEKRYVNLIPVKGGMTEVYLLKDIVSYFLEGKDLIPLTKDELKFLVNNTNDVFKDVLDSSEVCKLEHHYTNEKGLNVYVQPTETGTVFYTQYYDYKLSNGFIKSHYQVTVNIREDNLQVNTFYTRTNIFDIRDKYYITDLSTVDSEVLKLMSLELTNR